MRLELQKERRELHALNVNKHVDNDGRVTYRPERCGADQEPRVWVRFVSEDGEKRGVEVQIKDIWMIMASVEYGMERRDVIILVCEGSGLDK